MYIYIHIFVHICSMDIQWYPSMSATHQLLQAPDLIGPILFMFLQVPGSNEFDDIFQLFPRFRGNLLQQARVAHWKEGPSRLRREFASDRRPCSSEGDGNGEHGWEMAFFNGHWMEKYRTFKWGSAMAIQRYPTIDPLGFDHFEPYDYCIYIDIHWLIYFPCL